MTGPVGEPADTYFIAHNNTGLYLQWTHPAVLARCRFANYRHAPVLPHPWVGRTAAGGPPPPVTCLRTYRGTSTPPKAGSCPACCGCKASRIARGTNSPGPSCNWRPGPHRSSAVAETRREGDPPPLPTSRAPFVRACRGVPSAPHLHPHHHPPHHPEVAGVRCGRW